MKLKILTDLEESKNELIHKVSWPTKENLLNSSILVMVASIIISIVILCMDKVIENIMQFIYSL
ncbi:MAG: preprotein translocase subunit SecE [Muribaculaceae bacterium]|nr:preprotein translocase subunit SecE [Muribaculaceae bacterium]